MKFISRGGALSDKSVACALASTVLVVGVLTSSGQAQQWSGIIDPSRAVDWSGAGVTGGIPSRSTVCANPSLVSPDTVMNISSISQAAYPSKTVTVNTTGALTSHVAPTHYILIAGVTADPGYNGTFEIQSVGTNTFTYNAFSDSLVSSGGAVGTATATRAEENTAAINAAIGGCAANQVVSLPSGTWHVAGIGVYSHDNVTIRGAGADQTILMANQGDPCHGLYSAVCFTSADSHHSHGLSNLVSWTAGYAQGTTTITLASVPNLKVGSPIILDQLSDSAAPCDDGSIVVQDSTTACASATSPGITGPFSLEGNAGNAARLGRDQVQVVTVTSCGGVTTPGDPCSGTNVSVGISPGLYMTNWSSGKSPEAWWANYPIQGVGLEDVSVDASGVPLIGVEFFNCLNCWVTGSRLVATSRAHVQITQSAHVTVRNTYQYLTRNSQSQSYGTECALGSDLLVENNIYQGIAAPDMINGACSGTVIAYNYSINNFYTASIGFNSGSADTHTAGIDNLLFEGNVGGQYSADVFHGTHHKVTLFRNRLSGPQPACWLSGSDFLTATFGACGNNLSPIVLLSFSRFFNVIGNVLGITGTPTGYTSGNSPIYALGYGDSENGVTVPSDPNVTTTLMRWGNCDADTGFSSCVFNPCGGSELADRHAGAVRQRRSGEQQSACVLLLQLAAVMVAADEGVAANRP
jgi:hypothetical protein